MISFVFFLKYKIFRFLYSRYPIILLYHEVPKVEIQEGSYGFNKRIFDEQIHILSKYCDIVDFRRFNQKRGAFSKLQIIITFDDGFKNNFEVALPILIKYSAKAIFFISSRHIGSTQVLWFQYLKLFNLFCGNADQIIKGLNIENVANFDEYKDYLLSLENHPDSIYLELDRLPPLNDFLSDEQINDWAMGMTVEQVKLMSENELFSIGIHTADHPFLTKSNIKIAEDQIIKNINFIKDITMKRPEAIAYPSGDYNEGIIALCNNLQVKYGFAVYNKRFSNDPIFEIPRIGIYTVSLNHLILKVMGAKLFLSQKFDWIKSIFK